MFLLTRPSDDQIDAFLAQQQKADFSYPDVGLSQSLSAPVGFVVDHNRVKLGAGQMTFLEAQAAIRAWKMFAIDWLKLCWPETLIAEGETVGVLVHLFGLWSLNACRIVYVIDESTDATKRYGFAYGTLAEHAERGEERFVVEWDRETEEVWYDLWAFSRPNHVTAKVGYPVARWMQRRFAVESKQAMKHAVDGGRS